MPKGFPIDLRGHAKDGIRVLGKYDHRVGNSVYWWYECECGEIDVACTSNLGRMQSCGCRNNAARRQRNGTRHPCWLGGKHNHGSIAWCQKKLRELSAKAKYRGYAPPKISPERLSRLWADGHGKCAICGVPDLECDRALAVDHCHVTGIVRGFLCHGCNPMLGLARDSAAILRDAARYLEEVRGA